MDIEDLSSLREYLAGRGLEVKQSKILAGGVSNRTVLVDLTDNSSMVIKQARDRLKGRSDWRSDPRRIRQEALAMAWIPKWGGAASTPRLYFFDEQNCILAMEAIPETHQEWKQELLAGNINEHAFATFGHLLAAIHRGSYLDRSTVEPLFRDQSFFYSLRLEAYYLFAIERVPETSGFLRQLVQECQTLRFALVHGDYSPKNILVNGSAMVLLDHEAANFGDPAFDVGFALTHLLSKAHHLREYREAMRAGAQKFWQAYGTNLPDVPEFAGISERSVRQTLGCCLARVAGRSLLEYQSDRERDVQREITLDLIATPPQRIEDLIDAFVDALPRA